MINHNWKTKYFSLLAGQSISLLTSNAVQLAVIWYITDMTGSAVILSIAGLAAFLPQGMIGLFAGAYIDKHDKKRIMIISDLAMAGFCLAAFFISEFWFTSIWIYIAMLAFRSVMSAFHSPAMLSITPHIVPEDHLLKCAGYSQSINSISLILSPAIAAALFAAMQVQYILFVDIGGAIIAVAIVWINKLPGYTSSHSEKTKIFKEIKDGFLTLKSDRLLMFLLILGAMFCLVFLPISSLYPLMSLGYFGAEKWQAGIVEAVFAFGMMIGGIILSRLNNKKPLIIIGSGMAVMGTMLIISGLLPRDMIWVFVAINLFFGAAGPLFTGTQTALMQRRIPADYLGRVFSVMQSVMVIAMAIGLLVSGLIAESVGINIWFAICGGLLLLLALTAFIYSRKNTYQDCKSSCVAQTVVAEDTENISD